MEEPLSILISRKTIVSKKLCIKAECVGVCFALYIYCKG